MIKNLPANGGDAGRYKFNPWVRKIPWCKKEQPTQVFLPGKIPWMEEPGGLQHMGLQRVGHNLARALRKTTLGCHKLFVGN